MYVISIYSYISGASSLSGLSLCIIILWLIIFTTHNQGHTLDVVLARYDSPSITNIDIRNVELSDHYMITFDVEADIVQHEMKTVCHRNFSDHEKFLSDVKERFETLKHTLSTSTMCESVTTYNSILSELFKEHNPSRSKQIKIVPNAPWFDSEYKELRKQRRKAEKRYRKTKSTEDKNTFTGLRKQTTSLAFNKQKDYYVKKIGGCKGQKELFSCVNRLLDTKKEPVLPEHTSEQELANEFAKYFKEKISKIRQSFPKKGNSTTSGASFCGTPLYEFEPTTDEEITSIILKYGIKCAPHDPIPANVLKTTYQVFIPIWKELVNLSLFTGSMECLKSGVLLPAIKGMDDLMDSDLYKNYRPITNLVFVGKLIERIVKKRTDCHMDINNLHCKNQYGYKNEHSTELLMTKVTNDLFVSCDNKNPTLLMFLDLSAAFVTVDQEKLLNILDKEMGIRRTALEWYRSFLQCKTYHIRWNIPHLLHFSHCWLLCFRS